MSEVNFFIKRENGAIKASFSTVANHTYTLLLKFYIMLAISQKANRLVKVFASNITIRCNFSFAGPRKLEEIVKMELLKGKNKSEISEIWLSYHENKE